MARSFLAFGTEGTVFDKAAPARSARSAPKPHLVLEGVAFTPAGGRWGRAAPPAIEWLDLSVGRGEIVSLLGPAGAGKTACLHLLAGFVAADRGRLALGGQVLGHLPPAERSMGLVPRPLALFPRLTALENAAFPLEARGIGRAERERRAAEALARFGFRDAPGARPADLPAEDALAVASPGRRCTGRKPCCSMTRWAACPTRRRGRRPCGARCVNWA
ncbi:ATP-binding cassette domain-containing protein [Roseomonas sp. CCTCC AB2023176]|uniref:ATP-binding cassette domain-containing protein n=1 Tax=Roseomonas sp. CCTCC AB2023176 TaxID=3342640 RepID=UPI0035DAFA1F